MSRALPGPTRRLAPSDPMPLPAWIFSHMAITSMLTPSGRGLGVPENDIDRWHQPCCGALAPVTAQGPDP